MLNKTSLSDVELEEFLNHAADNGARRALADIGLDETDATQDIRELRSLLSALQFAKKTIWQTTIRIITTELILALVAGTAVKLRLFGGLLGFAGSAFPEINKHY